MTTRVWRQSAHLEGRADGSERKEEGEACHLRQSTKVCPSLWLSIRHVEARRMEGKKRASKHDMVI